MTQQPVRNIAEQFRKRLPTFGAWTSLGHPSVTEIMAQAGVDFIGIDLEHSTISQEQAQRIIAASQAAGVACLPRLSWHNGEQIKRLLDSGADGLIVPNVSTVAEARRIIEWSKYPSLGRRSYGIARAQGYGFDFEAYTSAWNRRSTIIIQIESIAGVDAIDELLAIEQIDGAMLGPYDLSGSLGIPGRLTDQRVLDAGAAVIEACRRHRKACGTQIIEPTPQAIAAAFEQGFTFTVLASDVFLLWKWSQRMQSLMAQYREAAPCRRTAQRARRR